MHISLALFLIFYSAWTLIVHLGMLLGLNLTAVLVFFPIVMILLLCWYRVLMKEKWSVFKNNTEQFCSVLKLQDTSRTVHVFLFVLIVLPVILFWSWNIFWLLSILVLSFCLIRDDKIKPVETNPSPQDGRFFFIIFCVILATMLLSYAISRSDLDDAFYAAVAAFASSNPAHALAMGDPMLGEIGLPLIFPSYRFTSFELLSGAGGYLFSVPAIDFYYIYLLPIWVVASVVVNFLLSKELNPKYWILTGCLVLVLTILLGEMHRSPANFSFVRIFQGKAVFLSVLVPAIFYLTARYCSDRGTKADLLLLGCCQVSSVGLTNFGMLMGPIAGFSALVSNILLARSGCFKKFLYAFAVLFICLPYLVIVAIESNGSILLAFEPESASSVWASVFGTHQQYLIGILLLAGPILARNSVIRWRLAIPPLFLFTIFLNPFFSDFISKYITAPPTYWRVVWSFPILIYVSISLCMVLVELIGNRFHFLVRALLFIVVFSTSLYSLPFNTLREQNIGDVVGFAGWKIPRGHLTVSKIAMESINDGGRILAPDEIAGVISRFENHPRLITSRIAYLMFLRPFFQASEYAARYALFDFVTSNVERERETVLSALRVLDVSIVVLNENFENKYHIDVLQSGGYKLKDNMSGYYIWVRSNGAPLE